MRNWPQSGIFRASEYVLGLTQSFSDEDRASLRNAGINAGSLRSTARCIRLGRSVRP